MSEYIDMSILPALYLGYVVIADEALQEPAHVAGFFVGAIDA